MGLCQVCGGMGVLRQRTGFDEKGRSVYGNFQCYACEGTGRHGPPCWRRVGMWFRVQWWTVRAVFAMMRESWQHWKNRK